MKYHPTKGVERVAEKVTETEVAETNVVETEVVEIERPPAQQAGGPSSQAERAAGKTLRIVELTPAFASSWDAFVEHSPQGLPQHLAGWAQVLQATYGYPTHFAMAVEEGPAENAGEKNGVEPIEPPHALNVRGVLPLFLVASPLLGTRAMTTPGGLCAADDVAAGALITYAEAVARDNGAKSLVLHDTRLAHGTLPAQALHEARLLDLRAGRDAIWQGLDRNIRRQVRMAERNGVEVVIDRTGARLADFYQVMSRFTHQVGTPIFAPRFLEDVVQTFPRGVHLALAYHQGKPVGGYFQLALGTTLYGAWGATLPEALPLRTVYLAYWEIMADAIDQGFTTLDMGRSPAGSNAAKYKAQWGGDAVPVYQQAWRPDRAETMGTVSTLAQQDRRFRAFRRIWPKLPYHLSLWLGPLIRRHVPFG